MYCGRNAGRRIFVACRASTQTLTPLWLALRPRCMIPCKFQQIVQFFHELIEGL